MTLSKPMLEAFAREYFKEFPVRMSVNRRGGGFEIVASSTRRKYFYVAWLPARASQAEMAGAVHALRDEIARRERK